MVLFNITIKADLDIQSGFSDWVRREWLEEGPVTGLELPSRFFRLLGVDTSDGITFCLQHYFTDMEAYNRYIATADARFREEMAGRYRDKLVLFSSVLDEV